jgi:hypothetical protein
MEEQVEHMAIILEPTPHVTRNIKKSMWLVVASSSTSEQHAVQTPAWTPNVLAEEPTTVGTTDLASKRVVAVDGSSVMMYDISLLQL